jgi:small ligand-binding sensory domain FIST
VDAAAEAGRRAVSHLDSPPDFCVAFLTAEHGPRLESVLQTLAEATRTPYVVGCSAAGVLAEGREVESGPSVAVLAVRSERVRATPFLFTDDGDQGLSAGLRVGQRLASSRNTEDLVLVWPDPHRIRPDCLLQGIDATLGKISVAGAAASARHSGNGTFQFSGSEAGQGAVSGVRLGGEFRCRVAVTQGCRPLGGAVTVTRSHENLILEVDGRPALEVLLERVPPALLDDPDWSRDLVFVGLLPDDSGEDYLVRNILEIDPDTGVVAVADSIEEGQRIVFTLREAGAAREDAARMLRRVSQASTDEPRFGFYFNCLARGRSLYREDGVDAGLIRAALPNVPLIGLFGNCEIAPLAGTNRILTYTGVLVLVSD